MSKHKFYMMSGISGAGKTYIGQIISQRHPDILFIDQDRYFLKKKRTVKLSNGSKTKNYDCLESIDWKMLNDDVDEALTSSDVLLVGFALWQDKITTKTISHVHLTFDENVLEWSATSRACSKGWGDNDRKLEKDLLVLKELVMPFYALTLQNSKIDHFVNVSCHGERLLEDVIAAEVEDRFGLMSPTTPGL